MGDLAGRWRELNKAYWDERVPIHLGAALYDLEGFRARPDSLKDFETAMTEHNATVEWRHSLSTVVSAIAGAGLRIQFLHEHDHTFYLQRQSLERHDGDIYRHPEGAPRIPLTYSIRAEQA